MSSGSFRRVSARSRRHLLPKLGRVLLSFALVALLGAGAFPLGALAGGDADAGASAAAAADASASASSASSMSEQGAAAGEESTVSTSAAAASADALAAPAASTKAKRQASLRARAAAVNYFRVGNQEYSTLKSALSAADALSGDVSVYVLGDYPGDSGDQCVMSRGHTITLKPAEGVENPTITRLSTSGDFITVSRGGDAAAPALVIEGVTLDGNGSKMGNAGALVSLNVSWQTPGPALTLKNVTIQNYTGRDSTIYAQNAPCTITMANVTAKNCTATRSDGGLVYLGGGWEHGSTLTMTDCTVENCTASGAGGALYLGQNSTATLDGVTATGCEAKSGGGGFAYVEDGWSKTSSLSLSDCTVSGCTATQDGGALCIGAKNSLAFGGTVELDSNTSSGNGGAVSLKQGNTLTCTGDLVMKGNHADAHSGGALFLGEAGTLTVAGTTVADGNQSGSDGGAFYLGNSATTTFAGAVTMDSNACTKGRGGAIAADYNGADVIFEDDVTMDGNVAYGDGGALYSNNKLAFNGDLTLTNNKSTSGSGGAVADFWSESGEAHVVKGRTTMTGNAAQQNGGALCLKSHVEFQGGAELTDNHALAGNGGAAYLEYGAHLDLGNAATVTDNVAAAEGGGVYMRGGGAVVTLGGTTTIVNNLMGSSTARVTSNLHLASGQPIGSGNKVLVTGNLSGEVGVYTTIGTSGQAGGLFAFTSATDSTSVVGLQSFTNDLDGSLVGTAAKNVDASTSTANGVVWTKRTQFCKVLKKLDDSQKPADATGKSAFSFTISLASGTTARGYEIVRPGSSTPVEDNDSYDWSAPLTIELGDGDYVYVDNLGGNCTVNVSETDGSVHAAGRPSTAAKPYAGSVRVHDAVSTESTAWPSATGVKADIGGGKVTTIVFSNAYEVPQQSTTESFRVTKTVTGAYADKTKLFEFDASVGSGVYYEVWVGGQRTRAGYTTSDDPLMFWLSDGGYATFEGIPAGTKVSVEENLAPGDVAGYTATSAVTDADEAGSFGGAEVTGVQPGTDGSTVIAFSNAYQPAPVTGTSEGPGPWQVLLGCAAGTSAALTAAWAWRRRRPHGAHTAKRA